MFKQFAADALGLSDIGKIINPKDYDKVDSDDYIFHEDGEKIFFLIKSKMDEYCFTNLALIHVDGTSAMSKKRTVKRYDYYRFPITNVTIETAGTIDLDCEIKFNIGDLFFSIDVDKNQIEQLKDLYKSLIKINQTIASNSLMASKAKESLNVASSITTSVKMHEGNLAQDFININEYCFKWFENVYNTYTVKDFTDVFTNYINN